MTRGNLNRKSYVDNKGLTGNGYVFFLSILISACIVFMTRMKFTGSVWGTYEENYFDSFGLRAAALFIFLIPFVYAVISFLDRKLQLGISRIYIEEKSEKRRTILIWTCIIILSWLPYYLSYYPGGVYSDTFASINYVKSGILTNRHPFLYNCLIGLVIKVGGSLGKDLTWSMGLFLTVQMMLLEAEIILFLHWMLIKRVKRAIRILIMSFLVFFPLIPLNAISIWKDTPFCMAVLLWSIFLIDLHFDILNDEYKLRDQWKFILAMFLVAFTRNNGIYVIAFTAVVFLVTTCRRKFAGKWTAYAVLILTMAAIFLIQGPVYRMCGVAQTDTVENFGIPLQQIGSVVAYDGEITAAQKEAINHFLPYEGIKEHYSPGLVDNLKWKGGLDYDYLSGHVGEFLNLWMQLLLQNPKLYVKAYLLATAGFWNVDVATSDAYVQTFIWNNSYGLAQADYFEKWFGFSFQHFANPRHYISCAWLFWIFFACMIYAMRHYGWRNCYLFTPQIGVWLTLMVATPIASSLRYISPLLFTLPLVIIIPILLEREKQKEREDEKNCNTDTMLQ